jgi:metal-responsive CopG/Arc/MetJ family transcriptional regulator
MAEVVMLQVRLPRELVKRLDHWCIDHEQTRAQAVEQFVRQWLERTG